MAKKPSPESVKAVQKLLKEQGFYKGDISGVKNWATESAIREYQVKNKLKNTGEIDDVSADLVSKTALAKQSAQPSVKPAMPQAVDTTQGAAQYMEGNQPASAPPAPAAPQNDRVRGKGSREFRNKPDIPVLPLVPDKPAVPDEKPPVPPDAADPDDMPDIDPKTGKPWTRKGLREHIEVIKKESDDQAKRDVRAAKEKQADDNAGKPQWTKYEEAKAKYEARHGRPPPPNWISSASQTELADQATIPQAMKDLGIYSTYSGDTDPKTGLTKPEVWDKLFKGSGKQDEGWTEVDGGRVSADGRFQMPFGDKGRWGDVTAPMSLTLDRHFGGKDWLTKKAWSSATPDEQASMIRADAGIPTPQVWVTPTDTAAEVGADIAALDGTSVDQMTRLPVPAGARMVSGQSGSGFTTTKLPAAPPAQGAGSQAAGKLPAVDPETETIIDNAVKATRTKS
jgi:peptidoglycan hydrolase-like protein with peptidoglycan-binding domain